MSTPTHPLHVNVHQRLDYVWIVRYSDLNLISTICDSEKNARRAARDGERITKAKIQYETEETTPSAFQRGVDHFHHLVAQVGLTAVQQEFLQGTMEYVVDDNHQEFWAGFSAALNEAHVPPCTMDGSAAAWWAANYKGSGWLQAPEGHDCDQCGAAIPEGTFYFLGARFSHCQACANQPLVEEEPPTLPEGTEGQWWLTHFPGTHWVTAAKPRVCSGADTKRGCCGSLEIQVGQRYLRASRYGFCHQCAVRPVMASTPGSKSEDPFEGLI